LPAMATCQDANGIRTSGLPSPAPPLARNFAFTVEAP